MIGPFSTPGKRYVTKRPAQPRAAACAASAALPIAGVANPTAVTSGAGEPEAAVACSRSSAHSCATAPPSEWPAWAGGVSSCVFVACVSKPQLFTAADMSKERTRNNQHMSISDLTQNGYPWRLTYGGGWR